MEEFGGGADDGGPLRVRSPFDAVVVVGFQNGGRPLAKEESEYFMRIVHGGPSQVRDVENCLAQQIGTSGWAATASATAIRSSQFTPSSGI